MKCLVMSSSFCIFVLQFSYFFYLASATFIDSAFGVGDVPIVYLDFGCQGFETSLSAL